MSVVRGVSCVLNFRASCERRFHLPEHIWLFDCEVVQSGLWNTVCLRRSFTQTMKEASFAEEV